MTNAFDWQGAPSIFASDIRKDWTRTAVAKANVARKQKKPRVEPVIRERKAKEYKESGRPLIYIDEAELRRMRAKKWSMRKCAEAIGCNPKTIAYRLLMMLGTERVKGS